MGNTYTNVWSWFSFDTSLNRPIRVKQLSGQKNLIRFVCSVNLPWTPILYICACLYSTLTRCFLFSCLCNAYNFSAKDDYVRLRIHRQLHIDDIEDSCRLGINLSNNDDNDSAGFVDIHYIELGTSAFDSPSGVKGNFKTRYYALCSLCCQQA